ncbi:hypothetical protein BJV82DRAFT_523411 [Fennellomyces sp. T-0311]|nr:hypothetical protein BJV82DRAFT_523411 [Fennellomyces sp. T-0311]
MNPAQWQFSLSLDFVTKDQPALLDKRNGRVNTSQVPLYTEQIIYRGDEPKLLLESNYEIQGAYPRGFFVVMAKRSMQHNFVFRYPDHPWFEDLYGLRKSAYIEMRAEDGVQWELHLKISRDKQYLFGYLCKHETMLQIVKESMESLLYQRKLPLVLDLDDTLVRIVGAGNDRHVPENEVHLYGSRVVALADNRRVVLTERVHEFLDWAQNFYEISVCSLGDQNYVENVVNVLDPDRTRVRGILYSARFEHDYIKRSPDPSRPPKDLTALYPYCALKERALGCGFTLPLIIDDETRMWPSDQHDNIIVVKSQTGNPLWNVNLFPLIQETLMNIHQDFFRQLDSWRSKHMEAAQNGLICTREPPSSIGIYKTYLRSMFRDMIAARRN